MAEIASAEKKDFASSISITTPPVGSRRACAFLGCVGLSQAAFAFHQRERAFEFNGSVLVHSKSHDPHIHSHHSPQCEITLKLATGEMLEETQDEESHHTQIALTRRLLRLSKDNLQRAHSCISAVCNSMNHAQSSLKDHFIAFGMLCGTVETKQTLNVSHTHSGMSISFFFIAKSGIQEDTRVGVSAKHIDRCNDAQRVLVSHVHLVWNANFLLSLQKEDTQR